MYYVQVEVEISFEKTTALAKRFATVQAVRLRAHSDVVGDFHRRRSGDTLSKDILHGINVTIGDTIFSRFSPTSIEQRRRDVPASEGEKG